MKKRTLIFDPDRDFANTLASRLEAIGVESYATTEIVDATARMSWDSFDLVCVDVDIETGQGLAFCEFLSWNVDTRNIPVVVMTSRSHPDDIRRSCEFRPEFIRKSTNCWNDLESIVLNRWPQLAVETVT